MDAIDYPLSLNPAYHESAPEKAWLSHRRETEDQGEGYTLEITYFLREDYKQVEIMNVRTLKYTGVFPSKAEIMETAKAFLEDEYGFDVEFV